MERGKARVSGMGDSADFGVFCAKNNAILKVDDQEHSKSGLRARFLRSFLKATDDDDAISRDF